MMKELFLTKNTKSYQIENVKSIVTADEVINAQKVIEEIYVDEKVEDYILNLIFCYPRSIQQWIRGFVRYY